MESGGSKDFANICECVCVRYWFDLFRLLDRGHANLPPSKDSHLRVRASAEEKVHNAIRSI